MAGHRSVAVLCLGTLFFIILASQSANCQTRWRSDSDEDDSDVSGPAPTSVSRPTLPIDYWQNSAPSLVNLIYTWLHPSLAASSTPVVQVVVGRPTAPSLPPPERLPPPTDSLPSKGLSTNNNRPNGAGFHPHFGPSNSWKRSSKITPVGPGLYIVERGSLYSKSYAVYYSKWHSSSE